MNPIFKKNYIVAVLLFIIISSLITSALDYEDIAEEISDGLRLVYCFFVAISSAVGALIIVLSGIEWMSSSENPEDVARAKDRIMYALIALILISISCPLINTLVEAANIAPVACTCF